MSWASENRKFFKKGFRKKICERDGFRCQLCQKDLSELPQERILDHKIPLAKKGSNQQHNIWLLCMACDRKKKDTLLQPVVEQHIENRIEYLKRKMKLA